MKHCPTCKVERWGALAEDDRAYCRQLMDLAEAA